MLLFVLDVSLRATAAAAAVALVLTLLRVRSGTARHAAWSSVLVVMLTMPVLMAIVPDIEVPVPAAMAIELPPTAAAQPEATEVASAPLTAIAEPPERVTASVSTPNATVNWTTLALAVYSAIAALLLARLAAGWLKSRRMVHAATPVPVAGTQLVLCSSAIAAPLTTGILRPVIVLPPGWETWDAFTRRAVLAHEHAHIARRDTLVSFAAALNRAIFWFHPVAWWLERTIAVAAEHAADECAVREEAEPGAYAGVLLGFAEVVRQRGGRVAWQAVGMDGTGLLGVRIDRLLRGDALARMSVTRRLCTAVACAAVLVVAIACRQQVMATPLREDPDVAKQLAEQAAATKKFQAAVGLSLQDVDTLEARLATNPDDWDTREQLVTYYSAAKNVPWDRKVAGLRRHALWLIEHHPEGRIAPPALSPQYDPEGFAQAERLWQKHLSAPNAGPLLIYRAAQFFWRYDKPTAERLFLRGRELDADSSQLNARTPPGVAGYNWDVELARLYGAAILGNTDPYTRSYNAALADAPFAQEVRRKLEGSDDARLLTRVAQQITGARAQGGQRVPEMAELGRQYMTRALALNPALPSALALKTRLQLQERQDRIGTAAAKGTSVAPADQLLYFAQQAQMHYLRFEWLTRQPTGSAVADPVNKADERRAAEEKTSARKAAEEALKLAAANPDAPDAGLAFGTAHHTLGLLDLSDGDRSAATAHLLASLDGPALQNEPAGSMLWVRLANYLLKEGERDSVVRFFEGYGKVSPLNRERLLADARAVREGRMPQSYQHMFANPLFTEGYPGGLRQ